MTTYLNRSADDLIRTAQPTTAKDARLLLAGSQLLHDHPGLFEQLADLVYSRLTDNRAASVHECFERLRWDIHIRMSNDIAPLLARMLLYAYPNLAGKVALNPVSLDAALGMRVAQKKLPGDYAQRLEWCDGRPLTEQPPVLAPSKPVHHRKDRRTWTAWKSRLVRTHQAELFEVA